MDWTVLLPWLRSSRGLFREAQRAYQQHQGVQVHDHPGGGKVSRLYSNSTKKKSTS
jgi:hypothetical protein